MHVHIMSETAFNCEPRHVDARMQQGAVHVLVVNPVAGGSLKNVSKGYRDGVARHVQADRVMPERWSSETGQKKYCRRESKIFFTICYSIRMRLHACVMLRFGVCTFEHIHATSVRFWVASLQAHSAQCSHECMSMRPFSQA